MRGQERAARGRRLLAFCLLSSVSCLLAAGCRIDMQDQPRYEAYEPSRFFADGQASRPLVEGTVARGDLREDTYFYTGQEGGAGGQQQSASAAQPARATLSASGAVQQGAGDVNRRGNVAGGTPGAAGQAAAAGPDRFPFPVTEEVLKEGKERYEAFCAMCHGMTGEGDGMIVRRGFQRPPSFHDDRLQEGQSPASHFFDVVTNGWGAMPAYNYMIPPEHRWRIIAYVRALQLSRRLTPGDLGPEERERLLRGQQQQPPQGDGTHGGGRVGHGSQQ